MTWVELSRESRLGCYDTAEALVRRFLREGRRFQIQLLPRRVGTFRQLQLLRGRLQTRQGEFCFELSHGREVLLRP